MSFIVGAVNIYNVSGGNVQFGDILTYSPQSNSRSTVGSGASNTGGLVMTNNGRSVEGALGTMLNNLIDPTVTDVVNEANNQSPNREETPGA